MEEVASLREVGPGGCGLLLCLLSQAQENFLGDCSALSLGHPCRAPSAQYQEVLFVGGNGGEWGGMGRPTAAEGAEPQQSVSKVGAEGGRHLRALVTCEIR